MLAGPGSAVPTGLGAVAPANASNAGSRPARGRARVSSWGSASASVSSMARVMTA